MMINLRKEILGIVCENCPLSRADPKILSYHMREDVANAVVFFASEQAGWITGQLLFVHGGHRIALGTQ